MARRIEQSGLPEVRPVVGRFGKLNKVKNLGVTDLAEAERMQPLNGAQFHDFLSDLRKIAPERFKNHSPGYKKRKK